MSTSIPAARYWAITTRGLEPLARDEIEQTVDRVSAVEIGYRRVTFATERDPAALVGLRTADDVFVDLATWDHIDHRRAALAVLGEYARALDLRDAAALCREVRTLGTPPGFSVTANFVGRRNYSTDEIKTAVSSGIQDSHGWRYHSRDADADLNVRVFIEHQQAYLGVRLAQAPLHERTYKVVNLPGSLKPTVAAAMLVLGAYAGGERIIDPMCGVGTIPIEAGLLGLRATGGDQETNAVAAARANQAAAGISADLRQWDARSLPFEADTFDGAVCNLPWGRQIALDTDVDSFYLACLAEMSRVVEPNGRIVLLTNLQPLLRDCAAATGLAVEHEVEISLSGQTPSITTLIKPT